MEFPFKSQELKGQEKRREKGGTFKFGTEPMKV
jgi:hypothetical protein